MQNNGLLWVSGQYYNYILGLVSRSANYLYATWCNAEPTSAQYRAVLGFRACSYYRV